MRGILLLIICSLLLASCGGIKQVELSSLSQTPCKNEEALGDTAKFNGTVVDSLKGYMQEDVFYISMTVRTYCTSKITFNAERKGSLIKLFLTSSPAVKGNCTCLMYVTTSLKNIEPGDYKIMVVNEKGDKTLAELESAVK